MSGLLIGYARGSTDAQDLTGRRDALAALGVPPDRFYIAPTATGPGGAKLSLPAVGRHGRTSVPV